MKINFMENDNNLREELTELGLDVDMLLIDRLNGLSDLNDFKKAFNAQTLSILSFTEIMLTNFFDKHEILGYQKNILYCLNFNRPSVHLKSKKMFMTNMLAIFVVYNICFRHMGLKRIVYKGKSLSDEKKFIRLVYDMISYTIKHEGIYKKNDGSSVVLNDDGLVFNDLSLEIFKDFKHVVNGKLTTKNTFYIFDEPFVSDEFYEYYTNTFDLVKPNYLPNIFILNGITNENEYNIYNKYENKYKWSYSINPYYKNDEFLNTYSSNFNKVDWDVYMNLVIDKDLFDKVSKRNVLLNKNKFIRLWFKIKNKFKNFFK